MVNKKLIGNVGEKLANDFLIKNGFEILERNYRYKRIGEIDIIALKENLLLFVEVKRRNNSNFGGPLYSITKNKQNTIRKVANQYFFSKFYEKKWSLTCRFDMISIENDKIDWHKDIFR